VQHLGECGFHPGPQPGGEDERPNGHGVVL
jgi:hypothetical protein